MQPPQARAVDHAECVYVPAITVGHEFSESQLEEHWNRYTVLCKVSSGGEGIVTNLVAGAAPGP
jgi:hypothetical protein